MDKSFLTQYFSHKTDLTPLAPLPCKGMGESISPLLAAGALVRKGLGERLTEKYCFLPDTTDTPTLHVSCETSTAATSNRESVKILLIGSPRGVSNMIQTLYCLKFAEVTEWTPLQPTAKPGEVVSILIRQFSIR